VSSSLATVVYLLGIVGLFFLARERVSHVSKAIWIPIAWMFIAGSRMVSQWLQPGLEMNSPGQVIDGSPLDRFVLAALLGAGLTVLWGRRQLVGQFLRANAPILLFLLYCGMSMLWSDYPDVAFKRWTKALANFVMVLVVLTDAEPSAAFRYLVTRCGFLLIPLSVLLVKYYPEMGQQYSAWTGTRYYSGVTTGKNGLGYVCLIYGLGALWSLLQKLRGGDLRRKFWPLIAYGLTLTAALWLFVKADSATSFACFLIGAVFIAVMSFPVVERKPVSIVPMLGAATLLASIFLLFFNDGTGLVEAMGRDSTLSGRTALWNQLLAMVVNPVFGTGFESFWLGERMQTMWRLYWWHPNQAHNGYLETYINLGWIGVGLLGLLIVWGCRNVFAAFQRDPEAGKIRLAYFVAALLYNLTEAAFGGIHTVWITFLLAITAVPSPGTVRDV